MYVKAFNNVMAYHPKQTPVEMKVQFEAEFHKVDEKHAMRIFKQGWNDAVKTRHADAVITDTPKFYEWNWAVHPLKTACKRAFSASVRSQLEPKPSQPHKVYVPDKV